MQNVVGIDLGTNSLGINIWDKYAFGTMKNHIESSVDIFKNGVTKNKSTGRESSLAAERRTKRSRRNQIRSARTRKQATLKLLIKHGYCPLTMEELNKWRFQDEEKGYDRTYPTSEAFMQWLNLNFEGNEDNRADYTSVYQLRAELMERNFDFVNSEKERYKLGRALYHIAIHRGFKSSKGDKAGEEENEEIENIASSEVKKSSKLCELMAEKHFDTIGQAFYYLEKEGSFAEGEKGFRVRNSEYTAIRKQYSEEIEKIFKRQGLDLDSDFCKGILSKKKNEGTIFYKRPQKSQKGNIGKCFLEPDKPRCYLSHPEFEEFRALQLINNIRVKLSPDGDWIGLDNEQRQQLYNEKFLNSSKEYFKFEEIREVLEKMFETTFSKQAGTINYKDETSVSGCPITVRLNRLFDGRKFNEAIVNAEKYTVEDIWHICNNSDPYDEDDVNWFNEFAKNRLHFDDKKLKELRTLWKKTPDGYSNLSLKAIRRINVMLRQGMGYSDAVMFAKVPDIIGRERYAEIEDSIMDIADKFAKKYETERAKVRAENEKVDAYIVEHPDEDIKEHVRGFQAMPQKMKFFKQFMHKKFPDVKKYMWEKLYHHSDASFYPKAPRDKKYLADPIKGHIMPPSVKHALCILRKRVNALIENGDIDPESTRIVIETAREMCDANMKWAIDTYNTHRNAENKAIEKLIKELCKDYADKSVSDEEIEKARLLLEQGDRQNELLEDIGNAYNTYYNKNRKKLDNSEIAKKRYQLWKKQRYISIYTGNEIAFSNLFTPEYEKDHTLPISKSFDNSLANKTICETDYNKVKKILLPTALPDYENNIRHSIILDLWAQKVERLKRQVEEWNRKVKRAADPDTKNNALRQKYLYGMDLKYWEDKLSRFFVTKIDDRFRNSQLNDTRIMTRYAIHYLNSVFDKVSVQRGETTAKFREILGIEEKDRSKHYHHAIDALILSIIPHAKLRDEILETYYKIKEAQRFGMSEEEDKQKSILHTKLSSARLNDGEVKDAVEKIKTELIVSHEKKDNKMVRNNKRVRIRGKVVEGKWMRGDVVKGQLHKDTLYGAIKLREEPVQHVVRKPIKDIDIKNIVDDHVKKAIEYQMKQYGINSLSSSDDKPMWMMRWTKNPDGTENGVIIKEDKNGRPLLPIRHVRVFPTTQINTSCIPIKKTGRQSKKALVNLQDRSHKEYQYAEKGEYIACLVYSTMDSTNKILRGYKFITDFELANDKRANRDLASRCNTLKQFILSLAKYKYADIPQYRNRKFTGYIRMEIEHIINPGSVLVEKGDKTISERTFIVRKFNYVHGDKSGCIHAANHLDAKDGNLIEIKPSKLDSFEIVE